MEQKQTLMKEKTPMETAKIKNAKGKFRKDAFYCKRGFKRLAFC